MPTDPDAARLLFASARPMTSNYAMERSGNRQRVRAAGAQNIIAPAARGQCSRAAAHRER
jgi:hypothetical protein